MLTETIGKHRADLELLCSKGHEDLYRRFAQASERVDRLTKVIPPDNRAPDVASLQRMHEARVELDSVAAEIRRISGYEDFLAPPTYSQIEEAATSCPLVYLATPPGTAGLGLIVDSNGTSCLRFSKLTLDTLIDRLVNSADADGLGGYSEEYFRWRADPGDEEGRRTWFAALDATTEWLWDSLMGPLTTALSQQGHDHAVLIPMGLLGKLPLHAAWTEDSSRPRGRRYALDDFCFRYAPNARILHTTDEVASRVEAGSLLVVVEPEPVSASPLPAAEWEAEMARNHFAAGKCQVLAGSDAIPKEVLKSLPKHTVFHFSGHAYANLLSPLQGGLLLAGDELLTVADLLALRLEKSRLVVISACETALPGEEVPDELVGLPSAFVQAGAAGAVGSLWIVDDLSTAVLMAQFYELWREHGVAPAEALRQAQISVRDVGYGEEATRILSRSPRWGSEQEDALADLDLAHPFYWASFTYTGS